MSESGDANRRWATMLDAWAIPENLVDAAPEPPYFFDPSVFIAAAEESLARPDDSPSDVAARRALPPGGSVCDVGAGAGAASIRLAPARIVGVDGNRRLLDAFAGFAARAGIETTLVNGRWPDVADQCPTVDVVVCHHVVYNAPDLDAFALAMNEHATNRVVLELTVAHPMSWMAPYWDAMHGRSQPERPTVDDAAAVLRELGFELHEERWLRPVQMIGENEPDDLNRIARRLCLPADRYEELRRVLDANPPPRERDVATLWWDRA